MNARQTKKILKKQIENLKSDNNLMRKIIKNSPSMAELYDKYNEPLNITVSSLDIQEYRTKRFILPIDFYDCNKLELIKEDITEELFEEIKKHIKFELTNEYYQTALIASIL